MSQGGADDIRDNDDGRTDDGPRRRSGGCLDGQEGRRRTGHEPGKGSAMVEGRDVPWSIQDDGYAAGAVADSQVVSRGVAKSRPH